MIDDLAVTIVNLVGAVLMSSYTACFYYYSLRRLPVQKQIVFALTFYVTLNVYLKYGESDDSSGRYICGLVASGFAVGFFVSPLATLMHVISTKSTSTLPFYMILANFFLTGQWWLYGTILNDNFIKIPNFMGWCLSTLQLLLFVIFPSESLDEKIEKSFNGARPKDKRHPLQI